MYTVWDPETQGDKLGKNKPWQRLLSRMGLLVHLKLKRTLHCVQGSFVILCAEIKLV